jgi:hypothetical protein
MAIELKAGDLPVLQDVGGDVLLGCRGVYRRSRNGFEKVQ